MALAAAIAYNEDRQRSAGNRPDARSDRVREGLTGKALERDLDRYGDKMGGAAGHGMKIHGEMAHPEGAAKRIGHVSEKATKNALTPWKIFE